MPSTSDATPGARTRTYLSILFVQTFEYFLGPLDSMFDSNPHFLSVLERNSYSCERTNISGEKCLL